MSFYDEITKVNIMDYAREVDLMTDNDVARARGFYGFNFSSRSALPL